MNVSRHQVSLGALAVVLCLAFPMGVLSLLSPTTTGDQIDAADTIAVVTVEAMQVLPASDTTVLEIQVERYVAGNRFGGKASLNVDGRPPVEVGDRVLAMLSRDPTALLGAYVIEKDPVSLQLNVATPVSGLWSQGIGDQPPVALSLLELAIRVRRGLVDPQVLSAALAGGAVVGPADGDDGELYAAEAGDPGAPAPVDPDGYEPNDTVQTAWPVTLNSPALLTGNPICITGLTLTLGDVDFFSFNAAELTVLHAQTVLPEGVTDVNMDLDTIVGLFNSSRELIAFDDDSGQGGKLSLLVAPIPSDGTFTVGVEGSPDTDLDFSVGEGTSTGAYTLKLELERASFLTNFTELVVGVSPDSTFIEDFVGFREVDGKDVLIEGTATDGWGMTYSAQIPGGLTMVASGAGDQAGDPGFDPGLLPVPGAFVLGPFVDGQGYNRAGFAKASALVPYQLMPRRGVQIFTEYTLGLNQSSVKGRVTFKSASPSRIDDLTFTRLMDVDLFDPGGDHFFWHFDPSANARAFAAPAGENVGNVTEPAQGDDDAIGDFQAAFVIEPGTLGAGFAFTATNEMAFTLVSGFVTEDQAKDAAQQELEDCGSDSWVIAVDEDPDTGLFCAFGAGVSN